MSAAGISLRAASLAGMTFLLQTVSPVYAQSLIPSVRWNPSNEPTSPSAVNASWKDGIKAAAWVVNLFGERAAKTKIETMITNSEKSAGETLKWTGGGVLMNIRVIRQSHPETPLKSVGILGDQAFYVGAARTADEALFDSWRQPQLTQDVPEGWAEDPLGNMFIWVSVDQAGKPSSKVVESGLAQDLINRVQRDFGYYALDYYKQSWKATATWQNIAREAKTRLADRAAKRAVDDSLAQVLDSQKRVDSANKGLQEALDAEKRAAEATQFLRTMQGLITVVQLVQGIRDKMNEPVPELSAETKLDAVVNTWSKVADGKVQFRVQMAAEFDGSLGDLKTGLGLLGDAVKKAGAPPNVVGQLELRPKP